MQTKEKELIELVLTANNMCKHLHIEPYMEGSKIYFRNQNQFLSKFGEFYEKLGDFNKKYNII